MPKKKDAKERKEEKKVKIEAVTEEKVKVNEKKVETPEEYIIRSRVKGKLVLLTSENAKSHKRFPLHANATLKVSLTESEANYIQQRYSGKIVMRKVA